MLEANKQRREVQHRATAPSWPAEDPSWSNLTPVVAKRHSITPSHPSDVLTEFVRQTQRRRNFSGWARSDRESTAARICCNALLWFMPVEHLPTNSHFAHLSDRRICMSLGKKKQLYPISSFKSEKNIFVPSPCPSKGRTLPSRQELPPSKTCNKKEVLRGGGRGKGQGGKARR